ncbi:MAG: FCD domain-containing protein [Dehalobacterium sp.]
MERFDVNFDVKFEYEILKEMFNSNLPMGASALALSINVPQATIGRKLQELEYKGYLEKQSNKGRTLTNSGKEYYKKLENDLLKAQKFEELIDETNTFSQKRLLDILYVRKILEKETTKLATENITDAEIKQLEQLINIQEIKVAQNFLGDDEDLKLHRLLAHISGNDVLEQILTLILTQKRVYSNFSYIRKKLPTSIVTDHKSILNAIKSRDAEAAGNAMISHIEKIIDDVNMYFKDKS